MFLTLFFFFNDTATTEIYTLSLHDALPILKSKNVYSRVNSKATTQWRKTESANGVHIEGVASDNRSRWTPLDRKSGSAGMPRPISYAVFCLKKKKKKYKASDNKEKTTGSEK